ncbi:Octopamine receptor beta-2R [Trichinella pseudospiralis]|uniref:Octopamine receptor beta-2R n=1 Tax=Trichinella pseudospiralis TaxID=6337 RepID=A0A0V1JXI8_TRIPS|nr:Octopamine receptor beta-2R [Trichinella pseudospiralis]KRZ39722.1 Octopamine receptor beta-2R [Trichinella pseudospiralis]
MRRFDFAVDILTLVCAPLTVFFNTIVLYIAFQHVDMKQRLNQRFVVSMTVADLVYGLVYMSTRLYINYIPRWLCGPYYMTLWTCQIASVVFLLCLNIDKYISIRYPLRYPSVVTETFVNKQLIICWSLILIYCLLSFYCGPVVYEDVLLNECSILMKPVYYTIMLLVFYVLPMLLSVMISGYIAWKATRRSKLYQQFTVTGPHLKYKRRTLRRMFFVFISTIWTSVTFLPYRIALTALYLCQAYSNADLKFDIYSALKDHREAEIGELQTAQFDHHMWYNETFFDSPLTHHIIKLLDAEDGKTCSTGITEITIHTFLCLLPLGSVGNPLITILTQNVYRIHFQAVWDSLKIMCNLKKKRSPNSVNNNNKSKSTETLKEMVLKSPQSMT